MIYKHYAILTALVLVTSLFAMSLVSADLDSWFRSITGRATSNADANVTVTGANDVEVYVWNETLVNSAVDPNEGTFLDVVVNVTLTDQDGAADINTTSVFSNFTRSGEPVRENNSCSEGATFGNSINFTCTIRMWYFDEPGTWDIAVSAVDFGTTNRITNDTQTFTYLTLNSMQSNIDLISFGSVAQGNQNESAENDPLILNNTGNVVFTNVSINASNLVGEQVPSDYIHVANVSVSNSTSGSDGDARDECLNGVDSGITGTPLRNQTTFVQVADANLTRGNLSLNDGTAQEQLYFCIRTVPLGIQSQAYSTSLLGNWVVNTDP